MCQGTDARQIEELSEARDTQYFQSRQTLQEAKDTAITTHITHLIVKRSSRRSNVLGMGMGMELEMEMAIGMADGIVGNINEREIEFGKVSQC